MKWKIPDSSYASSKDWRFIYLLGYNSDLSWELRKSSLLSDKTLKLLAPSLKLALYPDHVGGERGLLPRGLGTRLA